MLFLSELAAPSFLAWLIIVPMSLSGFLLNTPAIHLRSMKRFY